MLLHFTKRRLQAAAIHEEDRCLANARLRSGTLSRDQRGANQGLTSSRMTMTLDPLLTAPPAIQIHALSALAAVVLGALVLFRRKGTATHKLLGRIWAGLMLVAATSAIFINEIQLIGPFSPIHIFVVMTYWGLWEGIRDIRRGNVSAHQSHMKTLYLGALLLAGAFTLLPGRRLNVMLFGPDAGWTPSLVAIGLVLGVTAFLWLRLLPKRRKRAIAP